jgi:hypothetical protein
MKKLREFRDWRFEQVEKVARMLYARAPFDVHTSEKTRWNLLVRQAFDFLDNLHKAHEEIAGRRRIQGERYAAMNIRLAEAEELPDIVPLDKAARWITHETHSDRALPKFEKFLHFNARRERVPLMRPDDDPAFRDKWAGLLPKLPAKKKRELDAQLKRWQENGIPRDQARNLKSLFEDEWPLVVADQNRAKSKRGDKRRGAKIPELRTALNAKPVKKSQSAT